MEGTAIDKVIYDPKTEFTVVNQTDDMIEFHDNQHNVYNLKIKKPLGKGGKGQVFLCKLKMRLGDQLVDGLVHSQGIVLKIDKTADEFAISKAFLEHDCKVLKTKFLMKGRKEDEDEDEEPYYYYLMEKASGDFGGLRKKLMSISAKDVSKQIALEACESIRQQLVCMLKEGYAYTDMKDLNCLYIEKGGHYRFMVGDLGSAFVDEDGDSLATYPAPEFTIYGGYESSCLGYFTLRKDGEKDGKIVKSAAPCMSWNIGILLYQLLPEPNVDHMAIINYNFPEAVRLMRAMREGDDDDDDEYRDDGKREYVAAIKAMKGAVTEYYGKKYRSYLKMDPKERHPIGESLV